MKIKYIAICLVLLCCFMGAASAAEDVSTDVVSDSVDDVVTVDAVQEEMSDSCTLDDTIIEETNEDVKTDETSEESAIVDSEPTRSTDIYVSNWGDLRTYSKKTDDNYIIHLNSVITYSSNSITFGNNATIIGSPSNYITGGDSNKILFSSTGSKNITFINVTFKDMTASVLMKLATTGINKYINCSFDNIYTTATQSSVIWNNNGWMTFTNCNFTNCNNSFGVITNHRTYNTVFMKVDDCNFENNYGRTEPGAINNCGILNVTDSKFQPIEIPVGAYRIGVRLDGGAKQDFIFDVLVVVDSLSVKIDDISSRINSNKKDISIVKFNSLYKGETPNFNNIKAFLVVDRFTKFVF